MTDTLAVSSIRVVRSGKALIEDVTFEAPFGSVTAVLGRNGAGKSTLLKAIAGVLPHSGDVTLGGRAMRALGTIERARRIAYVPQQSELRSVVSVREVVAHGRYAHGANPLRLAGLDLEAVSSALERTETTPLADRLFTTLSHGEKQRVLVARALATKALVLVLDEPTSALDVQHALRVCALLRSLSREGYCVLMALHSLQEALDWTDQAILLAEGRLVVAGETRSVLFEGPTQTVYGVRLLRDAGLAFRLSDRTSDETPP